MNKFGLTLCFAMLFVFGFTNGYAAQDSLVLYTKSGCSNCRATKQIFYQSRISYAEKTLDNDAFAPEMLRKLSAAGYRGDINLPVIFLNDKLYHPAYRNDTGLVSIPLQDVVDTIRNKVRRGELHLPEFKLTAQPATEHAVEGNSDCEMKASPIYLVCANYTTEQEAKIAVDKLITAGSIFAGYVFSDSKYRVFIKFVYDGERANADLAELRKKNKEAYLYQLP